MKVRAIFIAILIYLVTGCASNPGTLYSSIDSAEKAIPYGSIDVILGASPIDLPETIHGLSFSRKRFDITSSDPVIDFGKYKANYKLFQLKLEKDEQYKIHVVSFCDCLGFDKRILVPNAYVIDSQGETVDTTMSSQAASLSSAGFHLQGKALESGMYYLVFSANNSRPGATIGIEEAKVNGYVPTGIIVANKSNPYGKIMPSYEIVNE